jgi:formylglycine-generating enzyme required for sulfatase activity
MLPSLEWCTIPAGNVTISYRFLLEIVNSEAQWLEDERVFQVEAFRIAKYPVTNAQYALFMQAPNGFSNPEWWDFSPFARDWRAQHPQPYGPYFKGDDSPCNHVSWYDAMAFCGWLTGETQLPIMLPTEQQWQRAGQGDDGRVFPWGNEFERDRCNGNAISRSTSPVTLYPAGVSPYGVFDLVGNVEEWCLTAYKTGANDDLLTDSMRVYRGGSFNLGRLGMELTVRSGALPDYEKGLVGFRIVCGSLSI